MDARPEAGLDPATRAALARELLLARAAAGCVPLPSGWMPGFSLADAFAVARETVAIRQRAGDAVRGYKIGFTNRSIWPRYGVHAPIWAPVWASTLQVLDGTDAVLGLAGFSQPRLEPEVVFGFARAPEPGMDTAERLACVDWVAPGFEIVHTHFADWRFTAPDTVADFGLHGALRVGPRRPIDDWARAIDGADDPAPLARGSADWAARIAGRLARLTLRLLRDGHEVDRGRGSAVLDGPVQALMHFLDARDATTPDWTLAPGHVVTTGTITDAAPLVAGCTWHTETDEPLLAGLRLRISD